MTEHIWTTRDKRKIPVKDMSVEHINNCIEFLKKHY